MRKPFFKFISAAAIATSFVAHAQDSDPDFRKEERFHRIYKKYMEQPTSAEAWEKVLSNRPAKTYSIQENDTLWDISSTLFGESNYWPKIWSYNTDGILNPHEINPKQVIKFYPGTIAEAPTVGLAEKTDAPEAIPNQILEKKPDGSVESIQIPPPKRKSRPVVKKLPNSLPLYRLGVVNQPPLDVEVSGARVKYKAAPKFLSHYVLDQAPVSIGEVVELEEQDEASSTEFQRVIVRLKNPGDKKLVAYSAEATVKDPSQLFASKGTVVEIQGEIEVGERVNDGDHLFRATIKKVISPLEIGAKLMAGTISTFDSGATPVVTTTQSKIIGGEYARFEQNLFGLDNIVFLNAGGREGLQVGSTLQIYMNERLRKPKTYALDNDRVIGQVKIIHVADHFATGYVVDSTSEIMIGDYAGGRVKNSTASAMPESSSSSEGLDLDSELQGDDGGGGGSSSGDFQNDPALDAPSDEAPATGSEDELQL